MYQLKLPGQTVPFIFSPLVLFTKLTTSKPSSLVPITAPFVSGIRVASNNCQSARSRNCLAMNHYTELPICCIIKLNCQSLEDRVSDCQSTQSTRKKTRFLCGTLPVNSSFLKPKMWCCVNNCKFRQARVLDNW